MRGVSAEKLHSDRALDLVEIQIFPRALIAPENSFRGNKLSREHVCAVFFAKLAKDLVGNAGHGGEKQRELAVKPGKRGSAWSNGALE